MVQMQDTMPQQLRKLTVGLLLTALFIPYQLKGQFLKCTINSANVGEKVACLQ